MTVVRRRHNSQKMGRWRRRGAELVSRLPGSEPKVGSGVAPSDLAQQGRGANLRLIPMPSTFKHDVAITAADFDALAVAELKRRLEPHVTKGVYSRPAATDVSKTPPSAAALRKPI